MRGLAFMSAHGPRSNNTAREQKVLYLSSHLQVVGSQSLYCTDRTAQGTDCSTTGDTRDISFSKPVDRLGFVTSVSPSL